MHVATALFSLLLFGAEPWFAPPPEFAKDIGNYRSPLRFENGKPVRNAAEWRKRRQEILASWHKLMGAWPPVIQKPALEYLGESKRRDNFTQSRVKVEVAPGNRTTEGYLAVPDGRGPFPAVLV